MIKVLFLSCAVDLWRGLIVAFILISSSISISVSVDICSIDACPLISSSISAACGVAWTLFISLIVSFNLFSK